MTSCPNCNIELVKKTDGETGKRNRMECPKCGFRLSSIDTCPGCGERVGMSNMRNVFPTSISLCHKCTIALDDFAKVLYGELEEIEDRKSELLSLISNKLNEFIRR